VTISRAAEGLAQDMPNLPDDLGLALLRCAQTFNRTSAETYGTMWATGLMAAAKATKGSTIVPWTESPALLAARSASSERSRAASLAVKR